jgi:hypothetical protein
MRRIVFELENDRSSRCPSVMSGIITGPHFRKFFNSPKSFEVGTMVAVLEIGAFGTLSAIRFPSWMLSNSYHK